MAEVIWTQAALDDLAIVVRHVAEDSPVYAKRLGLQIVDAPRQLQTFPRSGRKVPEFDNDSIRELIYGSYRILYIIREHACYVVAVIHASRDLLRHLPLGEWITD
jgi:toxin ParE1/3/4